MDILRHIRDETEAYLETAVWAFGDICDEDGSGIVPLDDVIDASDLDDATMADALADCASFYRQARALLGDDHVGWGRLFLLSRDGHGTGFWDSGCDNADALHRIAKGFGPWDSLYSDGAVIAAEAWAREGATDTDCQ